MAVSQIVQLVTVLVPVCGGIFAVVKYIDVRNRELKAQRYQAYSELIRTLSGRRQDGSRTFLVEQISAIYQLREFEEYQETSVDILEASMRQPEWNNSLGAYAKRVIENLENGLSVKK